MKNLALITCILAVAACDNSKPAADKAADAGKAKAEAPAANDGAAVAEQDAEQDAENVAVADGEHDEANGCIYAEGENDEKDDAEEGCPHGEQADGEGALAAKTDGHFGEPFTQKEATPLAKAIETESKDGVLVSGEVEAVCQKKGCWMVVKDGDVSARVLMKDHGFSVPMDSRGKKVQVEGTLTSREFTEAQVKHLEKDGGGDPDKVSGTRKEHVLTASGVLIQS